MIHHSRATVCYPLTIALLLAGAAAAAEAPYGKGMTEANKDRLVLDDMQDVSDWANGSPEETKLYRSQQARGGKFALVFANVVDHTRGEPKYPIGWPRTNRSFVKEKRTDWSAYDFFECWIYVDTSRSELPSVPMGLGFSHPGHRRSTHLELRELKKGEWVHLVVPIARLDEPGAVQAVQFHISEASYKHGDKIDFAISGMCLSRYVEPAVEQVELRRKVVFSGDHWLVVAYGMVGTQGADAVTAELAIGQGEEPAAVVKTKAVRRGEIELPIPRKLAHGRWWAQIGLRDAAGKLIDRKREEFQVVEGPF